MFLYTPLPPKWPTTQMNEKPAALYFGVQQVDQTVSIHQTDRLAFFICFLHTDEVVREEISWGFEPAPSCRSLRYEITLSAYKSGLLICELREIITTKSLSLLSGIYRRGCHYCHNGLQRVAENRLIYFSFITFQIAASLSLRLSICLYDCMRACALDRPTDYFIIFEFHFR